MNILYIVGLVFSLCEIFGGFYLITHPDLGSDFARWMVGSLAILCSVAYIGIIVVKELLSRRFKRLLVEHEELTRGRN